MASIFSRIIRGEIPCVKICEDEHFFAFLDIRPITPGHTLVVPKQEVNEIFDCDSDLLAGFLPFSRPISKALKQVTGCARVGLLVAGFEVPHAHLHLVPIQHEGDLSFSHARSAAPGELAHMGNEIRAALEKWA